MAIKFASKKDFTLEDALTFCSKAKSEDPKKSAPRAAIYTGKIGRKSKQAIKVQAKNSPSASLKYASKFAKKFNVSNISERAFSVNLPVKIIIFIALTLVAVSIFCYQPAKICYTQIRNTEKASTELSLVKARNEKLSANVASLKTDEGIEDKAKDDYGYVLAGEGSAHISGIEKQEATKLLEYVDSEKVTAPDTALTKILDAVFAYDNTEK